MSVIAVVSVEYVLPVVVYRLILVAVPSIYIKS